MTRTARAEKAQETLRIIETGHYDVAGRSVDVRARIASAVAGTRLYRPDEFEPVLRSAKKYAQEQAYDTEIIVRNCTVLEGAAELTSQGAKVGCLNFASAKNPGGGFLGGAQAQEESLALSSALYCTLTEKPQMYQYNRSQSTLLYSDHMIYSPDVVFFRNDGGELLDEPYEMTVVTSPAVNIGAIVSNRPEELPLAEEVMLRRMDKMLALFLHHRLHHLLLGAWGCGVFRNDPADIARYFKSFLGPGGRYAGAFRQVLFAVYDRSAEGRNINAFRAAFDNVGVT